MIYINEAVPLYFIYVLPIIILNQVALSVCFGGSDFIKKLDHASGSEMLIDPLKADVHRLDKAE